LQGSLQEVHLAVARTAPAFSSLQLPALLLLLLLLLLPPHQVFCIHTEPNFSLPSNLDTCESILFLHNLTC
jgi:hypothetical protein